MAFLCKEVNLAVYFVCRNLVTVFCLFASPALAAERNQGILEIQIKDHREAIDDFAKLNINIDKILISPKSGLKFWQTSWKEFTPSIPTVDLTEYIGKKTASIFHRAIDAGSFDGFHLKLKNIDASLKKQHRAALVKNTIGSLKLSFQVPVKGATLLVLDLVVTDFSDHPPRGYELGIKGYELVTNGKSIQKIPPG
jgi:hypothetical protein